MSKFVQYLNEKQLYEDYKDLFHDIEVNYDINTRTARNIWDKLMKKNKNKVSVVIPLFNKTLNSDYKYTDKEKHANRLKQLLKDEIITQKLFNRKMREFGYE